MEKVLKDAILNGLYDTKYPGQVNLTPQLLSNSNEKNLAQLASRTHNC